MFASRRRQKVQLPYCSSYTLNIYRKLHIFDRTQAVIYAVREGVIDVGDLEYRPPREPSP
jgi:hypothetical protein